MKKAVTFSQANIPTWLSEEEHSCKGVGTPCTFLGHSFLICQMKGVVDLPSSSLSPAVL